MTPDYKSALGLTDEHCRRRRYDYRLRILILNGWVAVRSGLAASFTCAVKRYGAVVDAVDVGVPLIAPVLRLNDKPGGRDPLELTMDAAIFPRTASVAL
jgi:hypothetical protein